MMSLQSLEAQYRAFMVQLEQSQASIASQDLDGLEASVQAIDQALIRLAQVSAQLAGRPMLPGEDQAWDSLADAMRQALVRAEQNRELIQQWMGQTQDTLAHMSAGGRAVSGYAASGMSNAVEFLSARG
ncbi:MAG: hypothetical protein Q8L74_07660 [Nitrospirota bacterium]|nr:hypothetical protein [Nitrospirota bacterium]MDP2383787.1 hypothetical protein [Nitrospirota bacterium]MDP3598200.1 hypothetical protein [Nitrospirota bacterium]